MQYFVKNQNETKNADGDVKNWLMKFLKRMYTFSTIRVILKSSNFRTLNRRFYFIAISMYLKFSDILIDWRHYSRIILKCWHQTFIYASLIESFVKATLIIQIIFMDECPHFKQNWMYIHCECSCHAVCISNQWQLSNTSCWVISSPRNRFSDPDS